MINSVKTIENMINLMETIIKHDKNYYKSMKFMINS